MSARVGVTRRSRHDKERATGIPTSVRRDKRLGFSMIGIDRRNPLPGADRRLNGATNYTLSRRYAGGFGVPVSFPTFQPRSGPARPVTCLVAHSSHKHIFFFLIFFNNLPAFLATRGRSRYYGRISRAVAFPRKTIRWPDTGTVAPQVTVEQEAARKNVGG